MSPLSLFFGNINVSQRIESFREAEARLLEYAKTRFHPILQSPHSHSHHDAHDSSNHDFEIIDTPIAPPSVVRSDGSSQSVNDCRMGELVGDGGAWVKLRRRLCLRLHANSSGRTAQTLANLIISMELKWSIAN